MKTTLSVHLGPFTLHQIIGRGGMGDVWAGVHRGQNVPVAVKVLNRHVVWEETHVERFRDEVKAVARLSHPGIVVVLDYGQVPGRVPQEARELLTPGTPYLAMELARFGALDRITEPQPWPITRAVLMTLLDTLAHAHARGVIHRDIKPANVLICQDQDWPRHLKLTDFGIAHALDEVEHSGDHQKSAGTPTYMAPEQFQGLWRDYGPWTDLYALGCMGWELSAGAPPYVSDNFMVYAYKHMRADLPPMPEHCDAPPGFEGWLQRMMAKDPRRRFQRAADAAWALVQLDDDEAEPPQSEHDSIFTFDWTQRASDVTSSLSQWSMDPWKHDRSPLSELMFTRSDDHVATHPIGRTDDAVALAVALDIHTQMDEAVFPAGGPQNSTVEHIALSREDTPPLPISWRRARPPAPSMQLVGAGLGLYGLRAVPMVGRYSQRNSLWTMLREVQQQQQSQLVLIDGSAGVGKSRLARWLCERADELGAATILTATHNPIPGQADGIPRMLSRHFRVIGLNRDETLLRIKYLLRSQGVEDEYEWRAMTTLINPPAQTGAARIEPTPAPTWISDKAPDSESHFRPVEFNGPAEWYTLMERLLERQSRTRPVIVWLDDAQWGADAVGMAAHMMARREHYPQPVLWLLTAREEALEERPLVRDLLNHLMSLNGCSQLTLGPLSETERAALIEELLGLEGELATQVEERSGGNPLFAVQLIGDWVQRGVLQVGKTGFVLKPGELAQLPDDIYDIMNARIERILQAQPDHARFALELAATIGHEFDDREWDTVCSMAEVQLPSTLLEGLMQSNLIHPCDTGWVFTHGMLRESLMRAAEEQGRGAHWHLVCARALQHCHPDNARGIAERVGLHYLGAGDLAQAMIKLREAAQGHMHAGGYDQALSVIEQRERGLRQMKLPSNDPRWGEGALVRAHVFRHQGRLSASREISRSIEREARLHGWTHLLPRALQNTGDVARIQGDMHQAINIYQLAESLYAAQQDKRGQAAVRFGAADVQCQTGALQRAQSGFEDTWQIYRDLGLNGGVALSLHGLGSVALQLDDLPRAEDLFNQARVIFERQGSRVHVANCIKSLADVARFGGRLDEAQHGYEQALGFYTGIGSGDAVHTRMALGLLALNRGDYVEANAQLQICREAFELSGERDDLGRVHTQLLACLTDADDLNSWDTHFNTATTFLRETNRFDRDIAWPAALAGRFARERGDFERARQAYALALMQWNAAGLTQRAEEMKAALASLPD